MGGDGKRGECKRGEAGGGGERRGGFSSVFGRFVDRQTGTANITDTAQARKENKKKERGKKKQNKNTAGRVRGNYRGIYNSSTARRVIPHESSLNTRASPPPPLPSLLHISRPRNPHIHSRDPNHHLRVRGHIRTLCIEQRYHCPRVLVAESENLLFLLWRGCSGHHDQRWFRCGCRCGCGCWDWWARRGVVEPAGGRELFDDDCCVDYAHSLFCWEGCV